MLVLARTIPRLRRAFGEIKSGVRNGDAMSAIAISCDHLQFYTVLTPTMNETKCNGQKVMGTLNISYLVKFSG